MSMYQLAFIRGVYSQCGNLSIRFNVLKFQNALRHFNYFIFYDYKLTYFYTSSTSAFLK